MNHSLCCIDYTDFAHMSGTKMVFESWNKVYGIENSIIAGRG